MAKKKSRVPKSHGAPTREEGLMASKPTNHDKGKRSKRLSDKEVKRVFGIRTRKYSGKAVTKPKKK